MDEKPQSLHRIQLRPLSPWTTPWQADTLWGLLSWVCARRDGNEAVRERMIEPALAGSPPFVISDAFPEGCLPVPVTLKSAQSLKHYREQKQHELSTKKIRKARWITHAGFQEFRNGGFPEVSQFVVKNPIRGVYETHNQIDRHSNATGDGGSLFERDAWLLDSPRMCFDIYASGNEENIHFLLGLLDDLSFNGFGADVSNGKGEFEVVGLSDCQELSHTEHEPSGFMTLSTFQPAQGDSRQGQWENFVKFGKLGSDFGLENVFKRPIMMLRPGAVFNGGIAPLGRAIPMKEILSEAVVGDLNQRCVEIIHSAFTVSLGLHRMIGKPLGSRFPV